MAQRTVERHRVEISVTLDAELLQAVDAFVADHAGLDRSNVLDQALLLWNAHRQFVKASLTRAASKRAAAAEWASARPRTGARHGSSQKANASVADTE